MDNNELNRFGKYLFNTYFTEDLDIPIKINNRLKRTHAWFVQDDSPYIEVSKHVTEQSIYIIADILCHELTHYYLYKHGKPNDDNDIEFEALTYRNGISRTNSAIVENNIMKYRYFKHESKCNCGFKIESYFPVIDNEFRPILMCPKCNKPLIYNAIDEEYMDFIPGFKLRMMCDWYLEKIENESSISLEGEIKR